MDIRIPLVYSIVICSLLLCEFYSVNDFQFVYLHLFILYVVSFCLEQLSSFPGEESQLELLLGHITSPYVVSTSESFEFSLK